MTTASPAHSPSDGSPGGPLGAPGSAGAGRYGLGGIGDALRRAAESLWRERFWLLILIPFGLACWLPLSYSFSDWGRSDSPVTFQILVPFAVVALVWRMRDRLQTLWRRAARDDEARPRRLQQRRRSSSGNLLLLAAGCAIQLFAFLVHVNSFFAFGLILMAAGVVYYLYGPTILRALTVPLLVLLFTVDPPASLITIAQNRSAEATAKAVCVLYPLFGGHATATGAFVNLPGHSLEVAGSLSGASLLGIMLFAAFSYVLYTRRRLLPAVLTIVFTGAVTLIVHLVRVALAVRLSVSQPEASQMLQSVSPWLLAVLISAIVLYALQGTQLLLYRYLAAERRRAGRRQSDTLTGRIDRAVDPVFRASGKSVQRLAAKQRRLTVQIDDLLSRLFSGGRQQRRRGGDAGRSGKADRHR